MNRILILFTDKNDELVECNYRELHNQSIETENLMKDSTFDWQKKESEIIITISTQYFGSKK